MWISLSIDIITKNYVKRNSIINFCIGFVLLLAFHDWYAGLIASLARLCLRLCHSMIIIIFMENIFKAIAEFKPLSYSAFAIYGIIAVYIVSIILCVKKKQEWMRLIPCMIFSFVGLALGAWLFGVLSLAMYNVQNGIPLDWSIFSSAGIVFYGGLLGYLLTNALLLPRFIRDDRSIANDIIGTTIPLFHSFARVGCFFAGCCHGFPYSGALCVTSTHNGITGTYFPIMLVESAFNLLLFVVLLILLFKSVKLQGKLTRIYLWSYSIFRFIIEFFRGDEIRGGLWLLSFSQYISLGIIVYFVITLIKKRKSRNSI